jgi:hypothetical protein
MRPVTKKTTEAKGASLATALFEKRAREARQRSKAHSEDLTLRGTLRKELLILKDMEADLASFGNPPKE